MRALSLTIVSRARVYCDDASTDSSTDSSRLRESFFLLAPAIVLLDRPAGARRPHAWEPRVSSAKQFFRRAGAAAGGALKKLSKQPLQGKHVNFVPQRA